MKITITFSDSELKLLRRYLTRTLASPTAMKEKTTVSIQARILEIMKEWAAENGDQPIPRWKLENRFKKLKRRDLLPHLEALEDAGMLKFERRMCQADGTPLRGRPLEGYRLLKTLDME